MSSINWSLLPSDVLYTITKHLPFDPDYIRFRSVCTSWRSAAPQRPQLLWLIGHHNDNKGNKTIFSFYKFSCNGDRIIPIPEVTESSLFGGMPCCGSSHGWMALLDFTAPSIILWNPLTKSKIQLPTLPSFNELEIGKHNRKFSKVGKGSYACCFTECNFNKEVKQILSFKATEYFLANQVILSANPATSADYMVVAICSHCRRLVSYRAGDDAWTLIQCPRFQGWTTQAVFYKGHFYVTSVDAVFICIFDQNLTTEEIVSVHKISRFSLIDQSYLVESSGDLLLVTRTYPLWTENCSSFEVFKLEWEVQEKWFKLVKLNSLGENTLFLGQNHSFSINACRIPGCRMNSIYYTESNYRYEGLNDEYFKIYSLTDSSDEFISKDTDSLHVGWKPCIWFTPSLLS